MSRKDMSITVRNLTEAQYDWLEREKKETGNTLSSIIRFLILRSMPAGQEFKDDD